MRTIFTSILLCFILGFMNSVQAADVVESGTAYRWSGNTVSTSNNNMVLETRLNDNDLTTDLRLSGDNNGEPVSNAYQAAGLIFSSAKTITKFIFINGTFGGLGAVYPGVWDDGCFEVDFKLQTSVDGTTWTDATGWTLTPAYDYMNTSVSGATFTFTGSAANILGVRVTGKVRTSETTGSWDVRAREITAYSGGTADVPDLQNESNILLYSNPSKYNLTIANIPSKAAIKIVSMNGSVVSKVFAKSETVEFNVRQWSKGLYLVYVETGTNTVVRKAIVQ